MSEEISVEVSVPEEADLTPGEQWVREGAATLRQTRLGLALEYAGIALVLLSVAGA